MLQKGSHPSKSIILWQHKALDLNSIHQNLIHYLLHFERLILMLSRKRIYALRPFVHPIIYNLLSWGSSTQQLWDKCNVPILPFLCLVCFSVRFCDTLTPRLPIHFINSFSIQFPIVTRWGFSPRARARNLRRECSRLGHVIVKTWWSGVSSDIKLIWHPLSQLKSAILWMRLMKYSYRNPNCSGRSSGRRPWLDVSTGFIGYKGSIVISPNKLDIFNSKPMVSLPLDS